MGQQGSEGSINGVGNQGGRDLSMRWDTKEVAWENYY